MTPEGRQSTAPGGPEERGSAPRAAIALFGACAAVGVAAWLAPASMQIVTWPTAGAGRVGLFAPASSLRWAVAAAVLATLVLWFAGAPTGRTRIARARALAPLNALWLWVLPFVPWVPDRLPLLLVFGGPVRWVIALAAVGACAVRLRPGGWPSQSPIVPGRRTAFAIALLVYLYAGHRSLAMVGLGGDEPHYLVIAQSLLLDHDLQIENNHQRGDYKAYFGGNLRPDYLARGVNGAIYSIHAPGLAALVAPAFKVAGAWGAVVTICLFGALAALAIFDLAALIGGAGAAWATWASVCLTVPFVPHAWSIFPEMPGATVAAWSLLWMARERRAGWAAWLWRGTCLAILPWLHTKFTVLVAVLALGLAWRIWSDSREDRSAPRGYESLVALAVPIAVSTIGWLAFFRIIYGGFDPQAPYGTYTTQFVMLSNIPRGLAGSLFDQKFGLLVYAPIYAVAIVGAARLLRDARWRPIAVVSIGLALVYLLSSVRLYMWWGGSSAPARFLVPVGPLLAPSLALAFARLRSGLGAAHVWLALAVSLFIAALSIADMAPPLLFSSPHGVAHLAEWLQGGAPLTAALPTFTEEDWRSPLIKLAVWAVAIAVAVLGAMLVKHQLRRRGSSSLLVPMLAEAILGIVVASLAASISSADARAETVQRGRLALLEQFDPGALRALDYRSGRFGRMTPDRWLDAGRLTIEIPADAEVDPLGRLTDGLSLPPGAYQIGVTFRDARPHAGDLLAAVGGGHALARADGPLGARVVLPVQMPVAVPHLWVQLSEPASARDARRVDIVPTSIVARRDRPDVDVGSVESIPFRPNAYIAYVNDYAFPEGGVFWTRGAGEGEVLVAPAGARRITLTLHLGPIGGTVHVRAGGQTLDTIMLPGETRPVSVEVPPGASYVRVLVRAPGAFRPSDYDRASTDQRSLGCQVRVEVSGPDEGP